MCTNNVGDPLGIDPIGGAVFKNVPEGAMINEAVETGLFKNPYGREKAGLDVLGAGPGAQVTSGGKTAPGQLNPNDASDRSVGRTIGTIAALYAGGAAMAASGGGAGEAAGGSEALGSGLTVGSAGASGITPGAAGASGISASGAAGTSLAPVAVTGAAAATGAAAEPVAAPAATSAASALQTAKTVATALTPVLSLVQSVANTKAIKQLSEPKAPPPITLPTSNTIKAQQGSIQQQLQRRGRASTILTAPTGEALGAS